MPESSKWKCEQSVISGLWKFGTDVQLHELKSVAEEWKEKDPDGWVELYIRGVGKGNMLGIGFRYQLKIPEAAGEAELTASLLKFKSNFFHKFTDQLKRRFGNSFIGWDISFPTWTLVN